ncbi:hypothetical protein YC2023_017753 [Brassica napus]
MNRPRKRKKSSLLNELKELELLGEGEFVDIPELENEDLIEENSMSIIVRCLNPTVHKVGGLVKALPPIWGLEESVKGRGVGENKVQFFFQHERDLQYVLIKGPWFVNGWIVSLGQWSPNPGPEFLCRIPFWIRIRGIPVHLLKKQAVEGLLGPLGRVEKVELHAKNSSSINTEEPLQFERTARLKSGEFVPTELEYEKLIKVCFLCKRLTHDQIYCDMQEDLAVDYRELRARSRQDTRPEARFSVSRQGKEDQGVRSATNGRHKGSRTSKSELAPRRSTNLPNRRGLERKEKNVVGEASQVWVPKSSQSLPLKKVGRSRSTEESSAHPENRSTSQGMIGTGASSGASQESPSVFKRLEGQKETSPQERQLSGSQRKEDRSSSSVFERLGGHDSSSQVGTRGDDLVEAMKVFKRKQGLEENTRKHLHRSLRD